MKKICLFFCVAVVLFFQTSFGARAAEPETEIITKIQLNWPYKAFLAIPRISETKPFLALEMSGSDEEVIDVSCVDLIYFEMQKLYQPDIVLDRESLHRLLCKAMKRAIAKTETSFFESIFKIREVLGLQFDFANGLIEVVEIPYPPASPVALLEDFFVDEDADIEFGNIDFPSEVVSEIKETPLSF